MTDTLTLDIAPRRATAPTLAPLPLSWSQMGRSVVFGASGIWAMYAVVFAGAPTWAEAFVGSLPALITAIGGFYWQHRRAEKDKHDAEIKAAQQYAATATQLDFAKREIVELRKEIVQVSRDVEERDDKILDLRRQANDQQAQLTTQATLLSTFYAALKAANAVTPELEISYQELRLTQRTWVTIGNVESGETPARFPGLGAQGES